jgi:hypothetical protein
MTVEDLIGMLEDENPEAEVRLMSQHNWPFENSLRDGLWKKPEQYPCPHGFDPCEDPECVCRDGETDFEPKNPPEAGVVYLVENMQLGYGTKAAWEEF